MLLIFWMSPGYQIELDQITKITELYQFYKRIRGIRRPSEDNLIKVFFKESISDLANF